MNKRLKVAVIGAGGWGYQHARAFSSREDAYLCSITGRTEEKTRRRAEAFKVPYYLDIDEMIRVENPDLISVCMPGQQTFGPTKTVIDAGIPLLVEKPLAYKVEEAEELIRLAKEKNLFFAINFNHRYGIPALRAKADMARLGELIFAIWRFGHESDSPLGHPHTNLIEAQCHGFDWLEHFCGPIASVMAEMTDMTGKNSYATFSLALRFQNGGVGSFLGTFDSDQHYRNAHYIELNGTTGRILIEDNIKRYSFQEANNPIAEVWESAYFRDEERAFNLNLDRYLNDMIPALSAGEAPPVPAERGLRALKLAYAAIESFETGKRVIV